MHCLLYSGACFVLFLVLFFVTVHLDGNNNLNTEHGQKRKYTTSSAISGAFTVVFLTLSLVFLVMHLKK